MKSAAHVGRVDQDIHVDGETHFASSMARYSASLSARSSLAPIGRLTQLNSGTDLDLRRAAKACARRSDASLPMDLPSARCSRFSSFKTDGSISMVVRMMR